MLRLRTDPWMPEYGMGYDVRIEEPDYPPEPFVETEDWSEPRGTGIVERVPLWFVDGVRRIELRLIADDDDGRRVRGLFGSYAVGAARCGEQAVFGDHRVGRALVLGGGALGDRTSVECGSSVLDFEPFSTPGTEPDAPLIRLQRLMREAEGSLASHVANEEDAVVLADGPLGVELLQATTPCPIVGVIKRFARDYLDPPQAALIPRLGPGQRTPLFALSEPESRVRRYAWYARIMAVRPPWHDHAGIVRCELRGGFAIERATDIADRVTSYLPTFAARPWDPRAPQNLVPISGLETWLRHRLGDAAVIRRALSAHLTELAAA